MMRNIGIWLVIGLAMMVLFNLLGPRSSGSRELPFSDFISKVESGSVLEVVMRGRQVEGLTDANERFQTQVLMKSRRRVGNSRPPLAPRLHIRSRPHRQSSFILKITFSI